MRFALLVVCSLSFCCGSLAGADWITAPSYYTHDPQTGKRVQQYAPIGPFFAPGQPNFVRSGFRHSRSSIQVGTSADHYHVTEEWGRPVRPYGEWRFPYRPYSVPYDLWGPQFGFLPLGPGFWPYGGGHGFSGRGRGPNSGFGNTHYGTVQDQLEPAFTPEQQLLDGRYAPFDELGPFDRQQILDRLYPPFPPHPAIPPGPSPAN